MIVDARNYSVTGSGTTKPKVVSESSGQGQPLINLMKNLRGTEAGFFDWPGFSERFMRCGRHFFGCQLSAARG